MLDTVLVLAGALFFVLAILYTEGCEKL